MLGIKAKKVLTFAIISLVGLSLGAAISFYIMLSLSAPVTSGQLRLPHINHQVEITFDSMGVCQIWAEIENDAWFALGYQHAADRLFQMDLSRRLAGGRLSEMLGDITRDLDIEQRRIGHHRLAQKALETLSEENRQRLQTYADGVNAYKNSCRALPFEYRFIPITFDDWTVLDCLTLLSFQTWFSNALMDRDDFYMDLVDKVGLERASSLVIPYPDWAPTTVPSTDALGNLPVKALPEGPHVSRLTTGLVPESAGSIYQHFQKEAAKNLFNRSRIPLTMTQSSNGWVVAPHRSTSGAAMLGSDPHLEVTRLPQFWYAAAVHVKQDSIDVLGITAPGLPTFIMGHNGKAAWAFTSGGVDVTDFYLEEINPNDTNQYLTADGWRDFDIIHDSIYISNFDSSVHVSFRETIHGPVVEDADKKDRIYSFHWAGFDIVMDRSVTAAFELHRVQSFEQFRNVVTGLGALDANMLYADINGNIGYQLSTPVRAEADKQAPFAASGEDTPGSMPRFLPLSETPHVENPSCGWIASANNLPQRSDHMQGHFFSNRIISITQLLESKEKFSPNDMHQFQMDQHDRYYLRFRDEFVRTLETLEQNEWAERVRNWDGSMDTSSQEGALIEIYLSRLTELTFEDELEELYHRVPSKWIEALDQVAEAGWFNDVATPGVVETYEDVSVNAMEEALAAVNGASWGDIHSLSMQHPLGQIPIISGLLNLTSGPTAWGGSAGTLNAAFSRETGDGRYECMAGPSWRFVIDFGDVDAATMVLPAGNSGNPMSDHFFDFHEMWKEGRYWTVPFHYEKVKEKAASILYLLPDSVTHP
ncbi:MAG: penicillin acylase family protein [Candidatus Zixiibacteriota bacterium]|nr:MAG: penicillin acylase family protein [candidate division Zixibacteria bacterium]